jgi:hypothetical protein
MLGFPTARRLLAGLAVCIFAPSLSIQGQDGSGAGLRPFPGPESLYYTVEWRLITAGKATVRLQNAPDDGAWRTSLELQSTGLVSKLYRVNDVYNAEYSHGFCASAVHLHAEEGKRRRDSSITFDPERKKAIYLEKDLVKDAVIKSSDIDVPACVHDIIGALMQLRTMRVEVGHSVELPISDGKKFAMVRVEAQERETVKIGKTAHKTVRYEANLFNNVIYHRKARLHLWLTDDSQRLPVQIRVRMSFPIGAITLTLDKREFT